MTFEDSLEQAGYEILEKIGSQAASNFSFSSGYPLPNKVTDRTGRLLDSILGLKESIREVKISGNVATFTIGSKVPYAALQEVGGVRVVTDKMRRFFWAKYFEARIIGDPLINMWSALRFRNVITYPARPFLSNAIDEVSKDIPKILDKYVIQYLKITIEQAITGTPRAVPLNAIK